MPVSQVERIRCHISEGRGSVPISASTGLTEHIKEGFPCQAYPCTLQKTQPHQAGQLPPSSHPPPPHTHTKRSYSEDRSQNKKLRIDSSALHTVGLAHCNAVTINHGSCTGKVMARGKTSRSSPSSLSVNL